MREIKFEYMFKYEDDGWHYDKALFTLDEIRKGAIDEWLSYSFVSCAEIVAIRQFIGLKDKNRKEIYIGDILNWDDKCTILIKEKDELGFYYEVLTQKDKNVVSFDIRFYRSEESAEIIGNIYKNPELLNNVKSASDEGVKE